MASELRVNQITSITGVGTVTFDAGGVTFSGSPNLGNAAITSINSGPIGGTRNRLINSAMEIDQRYAGGSVTLNNTNLYTVDRWQACASGGSGTGTATAQRVVDAPSGFVYSLKYTVTNSKTPSSSDQFWIYQPIEGQNIIDFAYGTVSAKTVTLSFWVKSSLTGTFSGFLRSQTAAPVYRSYNFNYTINSANTWEYKTITVPGDTGQVPALDTGSGYGILFDLGSGSNWQTSTLNSWQTGNYYRSTSSTNLISTNGATFQVTGVQLEIGTQATPFERKIIQQELSLCQRYFEQIDFAQRYAGYSGYLTAFSLLNFPFKQTKRTTSYTVYVSSSPGATWSSRTNTFVFYSPTPGGDNTAAPSATTKYSSSVTLTGAPSNGTTGGNGTVWVDDEL